MSKEAQNELRPAQTDMSFSVSYQSPEGHRPKQTHVKGRRLQEEKAASAVIFAIVNFAAEFRGLQIHHRNNTTAQNPRGILVTSFKQKA